MGPRVERVNTRRRAHHVPHTRTEYNFDVSLDVVIPSIRNMSMAEAHSESRKVILFISQGIVFGVTFMVVALRCYYRWLIRTVGLDDLLILVACVSLPLVSSWENTYTNSDYFSSFRFCSRYASAFPPNTDGHIIYQKSRTLRRWFRLPWLRS